MSEVDILITKTFVEYREDIVKAFKAKHPYVVGMLETAFGNSTNRVGLQVTESGKAIGEYTFVLTGIHITNTETGSLNSYIKHPILGIVLKPYLIIEKSAIEKMIEDTSYQVDLLGFITKFLPSMTIKFLP